MGCTVSAVDLAVRYDMQAHQEGGSFLELEPSDGAGRRASGSIYYCLPQGQISDFHQIDCDEYWAYVAGDTLELWVIDARGELSVDLLGVTEGAHPLIKVEAGCVFAARHACVVEDATFMSCITVPQFSYQGWRLYSHDEVTGRCPQTADFWE